MFEVHLRQSFSSGYIRNNQAQKAIDLFHEIENPDEVNVMLFFNACAHPTSAQALDLVKKLWKEMPESYHSNSHLTASLLDALIKCGDCSSAEILFATMKESVENYGNLMSGFNQENTPLKTINLFNQMKRNGIERTIISYMRVIKALAQLGDYETSRSIVEEIPDSYLLNDRIQTALVDMWVSSALIFYQSFFFSKKSFQGKTGNVDRAEEIFEKISQPDQVGYNTMSLFHFSHSRKVFDDFSFRS